jgi:hypothetical protein
VAGSVLLTFSKRIVHQKHIWHVLKTGIIGPGQFSQASSATPRILLSNRWKGFEVANLKKLSANSKAYGTKWLRIY